MWRVLIKRMGDSCGFSEKTVSQDSTFQAVDFVRTELVPLEQRKQFLLVIRNAQSSATDIIIRAKQSSAAV